VTCPMGIAIGPLLHELRDRLAEAGALPESLMRMRATVEKDNNVFGFPADERAGWVDYMDDPPDDLYQRQHAEVVYFVGCVSSFAPRAQRIAESFVHILDAAGVNFTILVGQKYAAAFAARRRDESRRRSADPQKHLRSVGQWGANGGFHLSGLPVNVAGRIPRAYAGVRCCIHRMIADLIEAERLKLKDLQSSVTYHDPCDLARTGGVFEAPRTVLRAIPGLSCVK